jgi:hypothetical protein
MFKFDPKDFPYQIAITPAEDKYGHYGFAIHKLTCIDNDPSHYTLDSLQPIAVLKDWDDVAVFLKQYNEMQQRIDQLSAQLERKRLSAHEYDSISVADGTIE